MWKEENSAEVIATKELITRSTDDEQQMMLYRKLNQLMPTEMSDLPHWQQDIDFLIDELEVPHSRKGPYRGRLDTKRIGILGYSRGGVLAGRVCATSDRVRAGADRQPPETAPSWLLTVPACSTVTWCSI